MAAPATSTLKLKYPLFCAEYIDDKTLIVGGGGGESKTGVGNGIHLIETSTEPIKVVASADLPKNEDAVMSLALLPSKNTIIGGVNQTSSTIEAGNNAHFRTFTVGSDAIAESSAKQHFKPKAWDDVYQRVTKASSSGRLAVIASSVPLVRGEGAYGGEVVVLAVDEKGNTSPVDRSVNEAEIVDVDITPATSESEKIQDVEYIAYSTPASVYIRKITPGGTTPSESSVAYTLPNAPTSGSTTRTKPQIRSIKLLSPTLLLILVNLPFRSGVELKLLSLSQSTGKITPTILETHTYHPPTAFRTGISAATSFDILALPRNTTSTSTPTQQLLLGIASADLSLIVTILDISFTQDQKVSNAKFRHYKKFSTTHAFPATKVAFSPPSPLREIQLASVSASNAVIVNRFKLADDYHLVKPNAWRDTLPILLFSIVFIILIAVGLQLVFEHRMKLPVLDIKEVWEEVLESVKGGAKVGEEEMKRLEKAGKKLRGELEGAGRGVKDGLKKEFVQGVLEGVIGMG